jgi:hypothetical protein
VIIYYGTITSPKEIFPNKTISGWFHIVYLDSHYSHNVEYVLISDQGNYIRLSIDENLFKPFGGPLAFNRKRVRIAGDDSRGVIRVHTIQFERLNNYEIIQRMPALRGSQPWVTILCRFADAVEITPKPKV